MRSQQLMWFCAHDVLLATMWLILIATPPPVSEKVFWQLVTGGIGLTVAALGYQCTLLMTVHLPAFRQRTWHWWEKDVYDPRQHWAIQRRALLVSFGCSGLLTAVAIICLEQWL